MNEYEDTLLGGTPTLSEEKRQELLQEQERTDQLIPQLEQTVESAQQQAPAPEATAQEPVAANRYRDAEGNLDIEKLRREGGEFDVAALTGVVDFGIDLLNLIPNVDIPKTSPFENEVAQSVREISSIVIPTLAIGGAASGAIKGAGAVQKSKFLSDPLVKHIGEAALGAGTGAFVDYTVEINQEDDNLSGSLRKNYPRWFGWLPEDLATLDEDSPDVKRSKNVLEGAYLGVGVDVLLGLNKLFKGVRGIDRSTQWVPESEKAKVWFDKNLEIDADTPEEVVERSAAKRSEALDEVGSYNFEQSPNLDQPVFGVHDLYGYQEQGIRSADDLGVIGAAVDYARIRKDIDTVYGRVGSVVTEGALKFGLEAADNQEIVIRGIAEQLKDAGEYGYNTASGRYLSHDEILESGEELAGMFYEMDVPQLKQAIKRFQGVDVDTGAPVLKSEAYAGAMGAIKRYMDDYINMDYMRAQAYVGTSFAGQISDMAQGMRLTEGTPAIERAQEQILDRVEFLMAQKGMTSYARGRALNMLNLWNRMSKKGTDAFQMAEAKRLENLVKNESNATLRAMERIKQEAKSVVDNLRVIKEERPEMLAPLMLAYELTDGNVNTITKLNNYVKASTGVLSKAFVDLTPEIPSVVLRGFWSNVYNSTLSAFATPIKAGLSNAALLIEKPVRTLAGGMAAKDNQTIRRGFYQYISMVETLQDSFGYMKEVFKRSGSDPYVVAARDDIGLKNERQLEILNQFADAKAERGDYGPQVMMQVINDMNALADHPYLRFGNRAMQALDGFTQSMIATAEAKGRAFDMVTKEGKEVFDAKKADALYKQVRSEMFDSNGLITDSAVKHTSGEIALNLDNAANDAFSGAIRRFPILKPFLLFTKTPLNEIALSASYTPLGIFSKARQDFDLPFEEMSGQRVEELLTARGIDLSNTPSIRAKYNELRADIKGREAIGNIAVASAFGLFFSDRITGNGLYDKQKHALRRDANWKPRSIRLPGGDWVSYDNLGPITNWLALTVDVMDNFDQLASNDIEEQLRKLGFVFASSITEKTTTSGLEVAFDVFRGDVGAIEKWSSSFLTSATIPGSSQLAEISRLIDPGLKEVEQDVFSLVRNRLPLLKGQLPAKHDWIDGGEVGVPDTFLARAWNTYSPWKISGKISDEKQFLMDIEYDARPTLQTNGKGVELTDDQRSEITDIMGRDGLFKDGIRRVMQSTDAKEFRRQYKEAVDAGLEPDLSKFQNLHFMLDRELRYAMRMASAKSTQRDDVSRQLYTQEVVGNYLRSGDQAAAERFLEYMKDFSY